MGVTERFRLLAESSGISQSEIGRRLGQSPSWVNDRLKGRTQVSGDEVAQLAAAMGVPIAAFYADAESPDPQGELRYAVARVLRRDPETVGPMGIALSADEAAEGEGPAPIVLQVGTNPAQVAERVVGALRPALDEVRDVLRELSGIVRGEAEARDANS